jgi:putative flippase GtrA
LLKDRVTQRLFLVYLAIGGTAFGVYLFLFNVLQSMNIPLTVSTSIAYFTATALHFVLNRYVNFRRFDRAVHDQARTFLAVIAMQWLITLVIVDVLAAHGVRPAIAATIAVAVNLPGGFIANRYLTFGVGIIPRMLGPRKASK